MDYLGAKSEEQLSKHLEKFDAAKKELTQLQDRLSKTKGPKAQAPIRDQIQKLEKQIEGHIKEMKQKWPDKAPSS